MSTSPRSVSFPSCLAPLVTAISLSACAEVRPTLPEEFLGQWFYSGSSGGLTGRGMGDEASGYIVIRPEGTIDRHAEGGTRVATTRFTATRGRTIFAAEDLWILEPESGEPEVIQLSADGRTMTLSENVHDGFLRSYARAR